MSIHEIVLPETEPETEWVDGRAIQKVSPTYSHAHLQRLMATALGAWADAGDHGRVGCEWRFRVAPPREIVRPLVPDVAYLSYDSLAKDAAPEAFEVPLGAPTIAVEILSPDDRPAHVTHKVHTYLAAGSNAVFVVDPTERTIVVHGSGLPQTLRDGATLTHAALPGFYLDLTTFFGRVRR